MKNTKELFKGLPGIREIVAERDALVAENRRLLIDAQRANARADQVTAREETAIAVSMDYFLLSTKGVVHVGANDGGERGIYRQHGLPVLWIEPIAEVFEQLQLNIAPFPDQRAIQALITDVDGKTYDFKVSNNAGLSSSIFDLADHKSVWPEVEFVESRKICGTTLPALAKAQAVDMSTYDSLVMDTQGSELLILKGIGDSLKRFRYVKTEAADFEMYSGACTLHELTEYLRPLGFEEVMRRRFAGRRRVGNCFDVVFERISDQPLDPVSDAPQQ